MRKLKSTLFGVLLGVLLAGIARADTFQLTDGRTVTGQVVAASANEVGVQIRTDDGKYERVSWDKFSQDDLKKFSADKKMGPFASIYVEVSPAERAKKNEIEIKKDYPRLALPQRYSLLRAMFASPLGLLILLTLYAATIYAGFEVAIFRRQPVGLVCGLAAIPVIGVLSPIAFLAMPRRRRDEEAEEEPLPPQRTMEIPAARAPEPVSPLTPPPPPQRPGSGTSVIIKPVVSAATSPATSAASSAPASAPATEVGATLPQTQIFQRGAYMFNRRFFETKFAGFCGVVHRDADKDMVLLIKSMRGDFLTDRIVSVGANDLRIQISKGDASEEIVLPFTEIKEIHLKHKNA